MSGHVKAVIFIVVFGIIAILVFRFTWPVFQEKYDLEATDAGEVQTVVNIGMDNWVGYFPLCSPEMKRRLRSRQILLRCVDDQADYANRFEALEKGRLQFAVATVDSYLLNGFETGYPGVIVAVIDESKGGDAIVAREQKVGNLNDLQSGSNFKIAFTPASPSEHLLKAISTHFDIPRLRSGQGDWRLHADGSNDALQKLLDGDADVAVLWEPDVSRALSKPGIRKIIGTEDTAKLIVDILLAGKDYIREQPGTVMTIVRAYFETLKYYHLNPDRLQADLEDSTDLNSAQVAAMLNGVSWVGLNQNAVEWYGLAGGGLYGDEALIDAINAALDILIDNRDFDDNPLPQQDPYRLTSRNTVQQLYDDRSFAGQSPGDAGSGRPLPAAFSKLDDDAWNQLKQIGTLRVEPISFRRGSGLLDLDGKKALDQVADRLKRYPNFRILIKGHSGVRGDARANLSLSADRAAAVARYLMVTYGIGENRIRSVGYGSSQPLPRLDGESDRAYSYRLPRVEIALVTEAY